MHTFCIQFQVNIQLDLPPLQMDAIYALGIVSQSFFCHFMRRLCLHSRIYWFIESLFASYCWMLNKMFRLHLLLTLVAEGRKTKSRTWSGHILLCHFINASYFSIIACPGKHNAFTINASASFPFYLYKYVFMCSCVCTLPPLCFYDCVYLWMNMPFHFRICVN